MARETGPCIEPNPHESTKLPHNTLVGKYVGVKRRDIEHLIIQLKKHLDKTRGAEVSKLSACFVEVDERNPVTITRGTRSQNR